MPCYHPLQGYRSKKKNESGKRSIVFKLRDGYHDLPVSVPCGRCIGCRLERSRQWALRCVLEASLYKHNCYITLTYNDEKLPKYGHLQLDDFTRFMKRLRKKLSPRKIRFFHCGEYGDNFGRPHYHALIFNYDFPDRKFWKSTQQKKILYRSKELESVWDLGYSNIGALTFQSAAYVARYILKKINGKNAEEHYEHIDMDTGEFIQRPPEYVTMSRRPGIAKKWFDKYHLDIYPKDYYIYKGIKMKAPKYFDSQFEILNPHEYNRIKNRREVQRLLNEEENSPERLETKEIVKLAQTMMLKRGFENGD